MNGGVDVWIRQARKAQGAGLLDQAAELYRRVLEAEPRHVEAPIRLVEVLEAQGRLADVLPILESAIREAPDGAGLRCAWADALHAQGDLPRAIEAYQVAVALDPAIEAAWWGLGCGCVAVDDHVTAAESFRRLTALRPEHGPAWLNRGKSLFEMGQVNAALDAYHAGVTAMPPDAACAILSNLAVVIPNAPSSNNQAILETRSDWAARCLPAAATGKVFSDRGPDVPGRRLRVGYVSAFFRRRNWMKPVWGLLELHHRGLFEVHVFSDGPEPDAAEGYRKHSDDRFHDVNGMSNAQLARLIEGERIDILVDLNSFSWPARLPLWMLRPAPIQVAWFNAFATSGMRCFDAMVGDAHVIPPAEEVFYTEPIVRVPGSYLTFRVSYPVPDVAPAPCVERGHITFGCLAPLYKITMDVVEAWSRILRESSGTTLVLKNSGLRHEAAREYVRGLLARFEIGGERVHLEGPAEHFAFLSRYNHIDVALDTFPYNGGTTTMEALWQGVPVLTFAGDRWIGRISASLLREASLAEFVARDLDGFVAQGIALARDAGTPARLDALRRTMRDRLCQAPVCDVARFTRDMEAIFTRLWQAYQERGG
jgi:predicted O-linked N-acetylglucosamine transferase (SPINDLY family)/Flp pilus assembly protein TadD